MVEFSELNDDDEPPPLEEIVTKADEEGRSPAALYLTPTLFPEYTTITPEIAEEPHSYVLSEVPLDLETTTLSLPPFEGSDADFGDHLVQYLCTIGPIFCDDPLYAVAEDRDEGPKIMFKFLRAREESLSQAGNRSYSIALGYRYEAQNFK